MQLRLGERGRPADVTIAFGAMAAGALAMALFWPFDRLPLLGTCPLRTYAHVPCPGCGMTRAFVRTVHGDLAGALHVSPLGTLLCLGAIGFAAYALVRASVARRPVEVVLTPAEQRVARVAFVALFAMNWLYLLATGAAS